MSEARRLGAALRHDAEELARLWRVARQGDRVGVSPGLCDGLVERFFAHAGRELEEGGPPEGAIQRTSGILRWIPGIAAEELRAEWEIAGEVLVAACGVQPPGEVAAFLGRAVEAARDACLAADGGRGPCPPRIVVVLALTAPPRR